LRISFHVNLYIHVVWNISEAPRLGSPLSSLEIISSLEVNHHFSRSPYYSLDFPFAFQYTTIPLQALPRYPLLRVEWRVLSQYFSLFHSSPSTPRVSTSPQFSGESGEYFPSTPHSSTPSNTLRVSTPPPSSPTLPSVLSSSSGHIPSLLFLRIQPPALVSLTLLPQDTAPSLFFLRTQPLHSSSSGHILFTPLPQDTAPSTPQPP